MSQVSLKGLGGTEAVEGEEMMSLLETLGSEKE
jgi:hypothetical protein